MKDSPSCEEKIVLARDRYQKKFVPRSFLSKEAIESGNKYSLSI